MHLPQMRSVFILSRRSCSILAHKTSSVFKMQKQPSSDLAAFRKCFDKARHIVVLTGAGVSAESGVPTFRGAGGLWRRFVAQELATPESFYANPSRVWEFYHYRREVMGSKEPNKAHIAIADCEKRLKAQGRRVVVITQNIDELHKRAGSENIFELHGNLFTTRCTKCQEVKKNYDSPICEALRDKGTGQVGVSLGMALQRPSEIQESHYIAAALGSDCVVMGEENPAAGHECQLKEEPDPETKDANIPEDQLPRCKKEGCGGLLRPHVVWFGEELSSVVLSQVDTELENCDLCLVVGTSSVVYPAAMFAPSVAARGVPVAEFNIEATGCTSQFGFHFEGACGSTLPEALAPTESEPKL